MGDSFLEKIPDFEQLQEFLGSSSSRMLEKERELTKDEIESIVNYLHNPTKMGIWTLKAQWNPDNSILRFIESEVDEFISKNQTLFITFGKREISFNLKNPEVMSNIKNNINKFTFIIRLFVYIHRTKMTDGEQSLDFLSSDFSQEDIMVFEMLDLNIIENKYKNAYNLFIDDIFHDELQPRIRQNEIFIFNKGNFILEKGITDSITLISINHDSIKIINNFLDSLNLIKEVDLEAYFSPEEVVFDQYITYLHEVFSKIIEYPVFIKLIQQAISEFKREMYSNCIGTIGIMAEDLLIQIYETLFRDEVPKGLSMGQMYDQIQINIKKRISEGVSPTIELNNLFDETNSNLKKLQSQDNVQNETLMLIRKMLQYTKEQNEITRDIIKKKLSSEITISVFPRKIQMNLNELLKYRNAISHKSRIPIGKYEATRTVFCVMTLLIWWNNERKQIEWEDSEEEIINKIIERNRTI